MAVIITGVSWKSTHIHPLDKIKIPEQHRWYYNSSTSCREIWIQSNMYIHVCPWLGVLGFQFQTDMKCSPGWSDYKTTCLFPERDSCYLLWVSADWQEANVSCVHLEETDFYVLVVWCNQDSSCVGAKYEDGYFLLSVSRCVQSADRISWDY